MTITAILQGFPPELRQPTRSAGESIFQFVTSHFPDEWRNFKARITREFAIKEGFLDQISGMGQVEHPEISAQLFSFINERLPTHWRTVRGLSGLKQITEAAGFPLEQILVPSTGDRNLTVLQELGAEVCPVTSGSSDLGSLLPQVRGDLCWTIKGGTRVSGSAALVLLPALQVFEKESALAFWYDRAYSFIYRTAALRKLANSGRALGIDARTLAKELYEAGFSVYIEEDAQSSFSTLEMIYGGPPQPGNVGG
jgi:hypothetical protein